MGSKGFTLIGAILIMTIFAALGVFMVSTLSTDTGIALDTLSSTQAFYIAEAGLKRVFYKLMNDVVFAANPYTVTGDIGEGSFSVTVVKDVNAYTLTSSATVDLIRRRLTQSATVVFTAFNFAIFGKGGTHTLVIDDDVVITGDVYYDGDVQVTLNASLIEGSVYADSVTGSGTYVPATQLDPKPPYPGFDSTWYDIQLADAKTYARGNLTLTSGTYDLGGRTEYYRKVTVSGSAIISGGGTIVATNDILLQDNALIIGDVALLTDMKLTMSNDSRIDSGELLYVERQCILEDFAELTAGNIIVPNPATRIKMIGNTRMTGAIYAYRLELSNYAHISGSVVAENFEFNAIRDNVTISYDPDIIVSLPVGLEGVSGVITTLDLGNDWDEIDPAD